MRPRDHLVPPHAVVPRLVPQEAHERVQVLHARALRGCDGSAARGRNRQTQDAHSARVRASIEFWMGVPVSPHRCSLESRQAARDAPVDLHLIVCVRDRPRTRQYHARRRWHTAAARRRSAEPHLRLVQHNALPVHAEQHPPAPLRRVHGAQPRPLLHAARDHLRDKRAVRGDYERNAARTRVNQTHTSARSCTHKHTQYEYARTNTHALRNIGTRTHGMPTQAHSATHSHTHQTPTCKFSHAYKNKYIHACTHTYITCHTQMKHTHEYTHTHTHTHTHTDTHTHTHTHKQHSHAHTHARIQHSTAHHSTQITSHTRPP